MDEPIELTDADLDQVSGGDGVFNFNNFVPNQGVQVLFVGALNNFVSNEGTQIGISLAG